MKNILTLICCTVVPLFAFTIRPAFAYVNQDTAIIRIMDKAAGKTQIVPIKVSETVNYDGLTITLRTCKKTDPFEAENFFAFLEIYTKTDGRIFSGWMNRNEPGYNPLQNDTYDVWIDKCEEHNNGKEKQNTEN